MISVHEIKPEPLGEGVHEDLDDDKRQARRVGQQFTK